MSNVKASKNTKALKEHYNESAFWCKVKMLGKRVLKPALLLYYVMKSPDTPLKIKASIAGALGYLILPIDLIPDMIPILGYTDDLAALWTLVKTCAVYITPEIKKQAEEKLGA